MNKSKIEKLRSGINKYQYLRQQLFSTNITANPDFKRTFNGFFRMRQRTEAYYTDYYLYLQQHKTAGISFDDALTYFYKKHGRLEMSFISKMVAIIDPTYPIWDSIVTKGHFGITSPYFNAKNRLQKGIDKYKLYCSKYKAYMQTAEAKEKIASFDKLFPNIEISDTKKLDFMLWQEL